MENCSQGVARICDVIEAVAQCSDGIGVSEIGRQTDLPKSTVHRILTSLAAKNYVQKDEATERYCLGYRFIAVAGEYMGQLNLRTACAPFLRQLSMDLAVTSHIAVLRDNMAVYIEKIQPYSYGCTYSEIGKTIELYCSSLGKCLLLGFSRSALEKYLEETDFVRFTDKTVDACTLKAELAEGRKSFVCYDIEEHEKGAFCVGSPIFDYTGQVIAAISISGITRDISVKPAYAKKLRSAAKAISTLFGGAKFFEENLQCR